jgi:hypothetical protein
MKRKLFRKKLDDFSFVFNNPEIQITRVINIGDKQIHKGDDIFCFHIFIVPQKIPPNTYVTFEYLEMPLFFFNVSTTTGVLEVVKQDERFFYLHESHQIEGDAEGYVNTIMISVQNNKITFDDSDVGVKFEPILPFLFKCPSGKNINFKSLNFIPFHPNDNLVEGANMLQISQRTPVWFSLKYSDHLDVTSSMSGKYGAGYFLDSKEEMNNNRMRSFMSFGRIYEDHVLYIAMFNYPTWEYYECGRGCFPDSEVDRLGLPKIRNISYGSSTDAFVIIPNITWKDLPNEKYYKPLGFDPRRCQLEFKTSFSSSKFPDYYIPQLYWEMIEGQCAHAILIRYKRRKGQVKGVYKTNHEAFAYHIYRDPELEMLLCKNVASMLTRDPSVSMLEHFNEHKKDYLAVQYKCKQVVEKTKPEPLIIPVEDLEKLEKRKYALINKITVKK